LLDEAERFVQASPEPDPAGALDHLYAAGNLGRPGVA
jgi:pyruvate dehydrogenase E1 component alpha subunit